LYTCTLYKKIDDLKDIWNSIYSNNPLLSPYQSYEFCNIVANDYRFSSLRFLLKPLFYKIEKDGKPIMIFPLWKKPSVKPPFFTYYLFPDFCLAGYLDPIYDINSTDEDFKNAFELIKSEINAPLFFRRVNEKSLFNKYMFSSFKYRDFAPCVKIAFENGYDNFYKALSKNVRQNIRTSYNRLVRDNVSYRLDVFHNEYLKDDIWDDVLYLHLKRKYLRDGIKEKGIRNYISRNHDPIEKALRGHKDNYLFLLYMNDSPAAYFAGFLTNDRKSLIIPRLSINDDFKFYSPGYVLITETIRYLEKEGEIKLIDLCHGDQSYKYSLGGKEHNNYYYDIK